MTDHTALSEEQGKPYMDLRIYLAERKAAVDAALDARLPAGDIDPRAIHEAMRYAVLGPGKRLRPIFALAVTELSDVSPENLLDAACAIEYAHAASLILDDLPCMDDAVERRGRRCLHVAVGEATALLSAMALLSSAFELAARNAAAYGGAALTAQVTGLLSDAVGTKGLIYGQHLDLHYTGQSTSLDTLECIHHLKAGALFHAAVAIPARILGMAEPDVVLLEHYARNVGLAFQITDDILDAEIPSEDAGKSTFTTHLGQAGARAKVHALIDEAVRATACFGDRAEPLRLLATFVSARVP